MLGEQLKYLALTQSVAVTGDAVKSISTCKKLELLDLWGTSIEVKERLTVNVIIESLPPVFPGCRSFLTVGLLAKTASVDLHPLPSITPPSAPPFPPYPCHPDLPTLPPRHLPF